MHLLFHNDTYFDFSKFLTKNILTYFLEFFFLFTKYLVKGEIYAEKLGNHDNNFYKNT